MKTFRVLGMRRSGNHAIINWLLSNYNNGICITETYQDESSEKDAYVPIFTNNKNILFFNSCVEDPFWNIKDCIEFENYSLILHSYEDKQFEYILEHSYNNCFNDEKDITNIIILRDPFNTFASRFKYENSDLFTKVDEFHVNLWIEYAEEALNITNYFDNKLIILYNEWLTNKNYRDDISKKLGIYNYDNIYDVSKCGNGSSFIGQNLDTVDNYLNRYKIIDLPQDIKNLLNTDKILDLTHKIFPTFSYI